MKPLFLLVFSFLAFVVASAQNEAAGIAGGTYTFHKVEQGETIFSISKRYLVSQKELLTANPELITGLKAGQTLRIPAAVQAGSPGATSAIGGKPEDQIATFQVYQVKKGDSLYFIAKKFGITVEDILTYNPVVRAGLKVGDILRIPDKEYLQTLKKGEQEAERAVPSSEKQKKPVTDATSGQLQPCQPDPRAAAKTYHIGLLLPFYLPANDTINRVRVTPDEMMSDSLLLGRIGNQQALPVDSFRQRPDVIVYPRSESFIHFYEGVLLAADSLKRAGMRLQLHVFDTNQKTSVIESLVRSGSLKGLDLIIGPAFPENQKPVADFAFQHRIPMISPLSSSGNFEDQNPWYFKVNPARNYLTQQTANYIVREYAGKNVIVLRMGDYSAIPEGELVKLVRSKLAANGHTRFHEYRLSAEGAAGLKALLSKDEENVFIIPSETEAHISVAVTTLNSLAEHYPVTLVGLSNFQRYKSVQTEYFHRIKLNYLSPYSVDYTAPVVNQFIRKFRRNFYAEPNQFSFQGYDVAFYFMTALFRYGNDFRGCLEGMNVSLTQSELSFGPVGSGAGYMNRGLFMMQYEPDYSVSMKGIMGIRSTDPLLETPKY